MMFWKPFHKIFDDSSAFIQRSLGLIWDLQHDVFMFRVTTTEKKITCTVVLATVNSLFDPLALIAPVTIEGKSLLRDLMSYEALNWDSPLPEAECRMWKDSRQHLKELEIPRPYTSTTLSNTQWKELHAFSDASVKAIATAAYLKVIDNEGKYQKVVFAHIIPRLELGVVVLGVEVAELAQGEFDVTMDMLQFYRQIQRIRKFSKPSRSWNSIRTGISANRLEHAALDTRVKFPLIIPGHNHIATLLVRHFHDKVRHQGRVFMEGAFYKAGFWIMGAKMCFDTHA
ncbi:hypothetical protein N1851_009402 [Merluccius polli]|uniref:Uncharacterized protein n=1 Tax=Merluccius polli TaxID=89951 RepID=A0AA47N1B8_MERPO|nr:hypothetical protein N1851_009402 [Merluccius polli]